jgi:hypothetical protein
MIETRKDCKPNPPPSRVLSDYDSAKARKLLVELARRRQESLRLYEPLPYQEAALRSPAKERLIRGSNQSGKTLTAAVDVAWKATGTHPYKKNFKREIYLVAKDEKQIGEVWWKKLCQEGPFEIIRDEKTGEWRAYRPWDESDKARREERQPAPPLIPERLWDGPPAWNKQNLGIPRLLKLKNGTRIHFFTGNARPPHGTQITDAYFDEEIGSQLWYSEIAARLLRFNGEFMWSATPQAATEGLYDLHLRAEEEMNKPAPAVTEHFLHITANPHIDEDAKQILLGKLTDPEQKRVRWDGEYAGSQLHIFPEWNANLHTGTMTKDGWVFGPDCKEPSVPIPKDWTRYMVVDPGHATCAVLFAAVPPPDFGDYIYLYDELYIQPCMNSEHFAKRVFETIHDDVFYEFIVDSHGGRTTEQGSGFTIAQQYSKALAKYKVRSETTAFDFIWGMDDVQSGNMAVHDWLYIRAKEGDSKIRVLKGMCPNFEFEIQRYRKKRAPDGTITDKPYDKYDHLMSCFRYLRGRNPKWHKPARQKTSKKPDGLDVLNSLKARSRKKPGGEFINLGPGSGQQLSRSA